MGGNLRQTYERERADLLTRLALSGDDSLTDAEVLELILAAEPGWLDVPALANRLLTTFGSLAQVIHAEDYALHAIEGMDAALIGRFKLLRLAMRRTLKSDFQENPVIGSWAVLMDYLRVAMGHERIEQFRVLFLDYKHMLLADIVMWQGSICHTPVCPREIVKRALELEAGGIILVHNHPPNDTTPSLADIDITRKIASAAAVFKITLYDHIVVTRSDCLSFLAAGLLKKPHKHAEAPSSEPSTGMA